MDEITQTSFYEPAGEEYTRNMYDFQGNWIGIESRKFVTRKEAEDMGYKLSPTIVK